MPIVVRTNSDVVLSNSSLQVVASCLSGEVRTNGGGFFSGPAVGNRGLQASFPATIESWVIHARNDTAVNQTINVQVLCLTL